MHNKWFMHNIWFLPYYCCVAIFFRFPSWTVKASRVVMKVIIYFNYNDAEYFKIKVVLTEVKEFFFFPHLAFNGPFEFIVYFS
jgi:hypothetical protein